MNQPKSVFATSTGIGAMIAGVAGLAIAIGNPAFSIWERHAQTEAAKGDIRDLKEIVLSLAGLITAGGGGLALIGRATATTKAYSPQFLPGHDEADLANPDQRNLK